MPLSPALPLADGHAIPRLGSGVWRLPDVDAPAVVAAAVSAGCRHIDTAQGYDNEEGVGRGLRAAPVPRGDLFVTSKERTRDQGYDSTLRSLEGILSRLGLDHLDLFLIHWPAPRHDRFVDTWKALVRLQAEGRVRSIGVSNVLPKHIERLVGETGIAPAVNQLELHPRFQQRDVRDWHAERRIVIESYSPLGGEGAALLADPVVTAVAGRHGRTPAQAIIRWHLQQALVVLPAGREPRARRRTSTSGTSTSTTTTWRASRGWTAPTARRSPRRRR